MTSVILHDVIPQRKLTAANGDCKSVMRKRVLLLYHRVNPKNDRILQLSTIRFHPQRVRRCRQAAREIDAPSADSTCCVRNFHRTRGGRNTRSWAFHGTRKVQQGTVKGCARGKGMQDNHMRCMHPCGPKRTRWNKALPPILVVKSSVKSTPPNTEKWLRKRYDENDDNNMSNETKRETNYSMNNK